MRRAVQNVTKIIQPTAKIRMTFYTAEKNISNGSAKPATGGVLMSSVAVPLATVL